MLDKVRKVLVSTIVKLNKAQKIDTFLYQHFKHTGHSPDSVLVQPVENCYMMKFFSEIQYHQKVRNRIKMDKIIAICFSSRF